MVKYQPKNVTRVIIVDDHPIFRDGLKAALSLFDGVEVVAEAADGEEFVEIVKKSDAQIVFMDVKMPKMNGDQAVIECKAICPKMKVIAVSAYDDYDNFMNMHEAGVDGYMVKNESVDGYREAIQCVLKGGNFYSSVVIEMLTEKINGAEKEKAIRKLTDKDIELLELICEGYSNAKIAEVFSKSIRTVERQKSQLMKKTQTENTLNLAIYAFKNKLV